MRTNIFFLETEHDALIECTAQWFNMYDRTVQKKIMERVVKHEEEEDEEEEEEDEDEEEVVEVEEEQAEPTEPTVPPPEMGSMEIQTDASFLSDQKTGSSSQKETSSIWKLF